MKSSVDVRSWRAGDLDRLRQLSTRLSEQTLRSRFWQSATAVPEPYLASIATRWPGEWDAVVAIRDGELVGWAEYGRNAPGSTDADAAFVVADSEQGQGIGTALLTALVPLSLRAGVRSMHADIAANNTAAMHAWHAATVGLATVGALGVDGYRLTVLAAAQPAQAA